MFSKLAFFLCCGAVVGLRVTPEATSPTWACKAGAAPASLPADHPAAVNMHAHNSTMVGEYAVEALDTASMSSLISAKSTDILAVFYAPWCPHCQTFVMHDGTGNKTNAPLENFNRDMMESKGPKVVKFDGAANEPPSQFKIEYYPSVFFVSKSGDVKPFTEDPHDLPTLRKFAMTSSGKTVSVLSTKRARLDINQKVYIENAAVLGDGAGEGALNVCRAFTDAHVSNPAAPVVKVCGTGIKATVFLRGRCEGYYEHSYVVGKCNSGDDSSTCDVVGPSDKAAYGHYQSYKIEQC